MGYYEIEERIKIRNDLTKGLRQKKITFKSESLWGAEIKAKRIIFELMCDRKIIREYDYNNKQKKSGKDEFRYRTLSWYPFDLSIKKRKYKISGYDDY